jgi:hypothetical protein
MLHCSAVLQCAPLATAVVPQGGPGDPICNHVTSCNPGHTRQHPLMTDKSNM